jgi:hypothetical protein
MSAVKPTVIDRLLLGKLQTPLKNRVLRLKRHQAAC